MSADRENLAEAGEQRCEQERSYTGDSIEGGKPRPREWRACQARLGSSKRYVASYQAIKNHLQIASERVEQDSTGDNLVSEQADWIDRATALAILCRSPRQLRRYVRARRIRTRRSEDGGLEYARADVVRLLSSPDNSDSLDREDRVDTPDRLDAPVISDGVDKEDTAVTTIQVEDDRHVPLNLSDLQRLPTLALISSIRQLQHALTEATIRERELRAQLAQREREHDVQHLRDEIHQIRRQRDRIGLALLAVVMLLVLAVAALLTLAVLGWRIVVRLGA